MRSCKSLFRADFKQVQEKSRSGPFPSILPVKTEKTSDIFELHATSCVEYNSCLGYIKCNYDKGVCIRGFLVTRSIESSNLKILLQKKRMKKALLGKHSLPLGLFAFIATGGGLLISTIYNEESIYKVEILLIFGVFFAISLADYYRRMQKSPVKPIMNRRSLYMILCSLISVLITWFINHEMGYGAVIANGLVGIIAATFLPGDLAGVTYTSSFVGMSSLTVLPDMGGAALAGVIVGLIIVSTAEIYAGFGGKGGTTAALSTQISRALLSIFR